MEATRDALRQVLVEKLDLEDTNDITDTQLDLLIENGYTSWHRLTAISRDTWQEFNLPRFYYDAIKAAGAASVGASTAGAAVAGPSTSGPHTTSLDDVMSVLQAIKSSNTASNMLLGLMFDNMLGPCGSESSRSSSCRGDTMEAYGVRRKTADGQCWAFCMVSHRWFPDDRRYIVAAHIYMVKWPAVVLSTLFGIGVNDAKNLLVMAKPLEHAFDRFYFCILVESEDLYKVHVLNPDLMTGQKACIIDGNLGSTRQWGPPGASDGDAGSEESSSSGSNGTLRWPQLHGTYIYRGIAMPARRLVSFHAFRAIRHAEQAGWIAPGEVQVPAAGWESPCIDNAEMLQRFLADSSAAAEEEMTALANKRVSRA